MQWVLRRVRPSDASYPHTYYTGQYGMYEIPGNLECIVFLGDLGSAKKYPSYGEANKDKMVLGASNCRLVPVTIRQALEDE